MIPDVSELSGPLDRNTSVGFRETRWSLVLRAQAGSDEAMEALGRAYWPAVYAFLRKKGLNAQDAEDVTQNTLARILQGEQLNSVREAKGYFRAFLRACANHEASHFFERRNAQKRGQGSTVSLEEVGAEDKRLPSPSEAGSDLVFDRAWGQTVVARALENLRKDYVRLGKLQLFEQLVPLLRGQSRGDFARLASALPNSENNLRTAWTRFKTSFRKYLREEVAETVADSSDLESELRHLVKAWLVAPSQS